MRFETGVDIGKTPRTVGELVACIRQQLFAAGIETAYQEASWLIEHALGLSGLEQTIERHRSLTTQEVKRAEAISARRVSREPLQYILGSQEFCGLQFEVNPTVLIPRPETELLVRESIRRRHQHLRPTMIDVGTGSGCLAVTLARTIPDARIIAIDQSEGAIQTARHNAIRHGVNSKISWMQGDLLSPLKDHGPDDGAAIIVSNPPYVSEAEWETLQPEVRLFEPRVALVAGPLGTELHERLLQDGWRFLAPGGWLIMELGKGQSSILKEKTQCLGPYCSVDVIQDEAGIDRLLLAERGA
ncbi:Release factor glutamine methyltransferase [Nitrospira sp. KM1]|uniref:peptide chain release factor N(5)-glutamine methyltransferase n=1 Tax=Nitrospira sp. KM1 TaxID=1936990 RepID=UPI0013A7539A|nr:peptide chain release factor N(5)-glutamine methyltransferase [Nitrospira sp. KM1]BCA56112.1 Release factor glutamine methyltransferase [Nitrospira sp. KM1]